MIKLKKIIKEDLFETDIEHTVGNALFAMETKKKKQMNIIKS